MWLPGRGDVMDSMDRKPQITVRKFQTMSKLQSPMAQTGSERHEFEDEDDDEESRKLASCVKTPTPGCAGDNGENGENA